MLQHSRIPCKMADDERRGPAWTLRHKCTPFGMGATYSSRLARSNACTKNRAATVFLTVALAPPAPRLRPDVPAAPNRTRRRRLDDVARWRLGRVAGVLAGLGQFGFELGDPSQRRCEFGAQLAHQRQQFWPPKLLRAVRLHATCCRHARGPTTAIFPSSPLKKPLTLPSPTAGRGETTAFFNGLLGVNGYL